MGFNIKRSQMDELSNRYANTVMSQVIDALKIIEEGIGKMSAGTFTGSGADSIRAYFNEVHVDLLSRIEVLVEQLYSDYMSKYMEKYDSDPICETRAYAQLPEDELERKRSYLAWVKDDGIYDIQSDIDKAINELPDDVVIDKPELSVIRGQFSLAHYDIEKLKNTVFDVECEAEAMFNNRTSEFSVLLERLNQVLAGIKIWPSDINEYTSGTYSEHIKQFELDKATLNCINDQIEHYGGMRSAERNLIDRDLYRFEEKARQAEEERHKWEAIGAGAGIAIMIGGAAAVIFSGGAALPIVLASASLGLASFDTIGRIDDLITDNNRQYGGSDSKRSSSYKNTVGIFFQEGYKHAGNGIAFNNYADAVLLSCELADPCANSKLIENARRIVGPSSSISGTVLRGVGATFSLAGNNCEELNVQIVGTAGSGIAYTAEAALLSGKAFPVATRVAGSACIGIGAAGEVTQIFADNQAEKAAREVIKYENKISALEQKKASIPQRPAYFSVVENGKEVSAYDYE